MKIGIITHYYKSENYGGNLQAYALCEYINRYLNCDAEQLSYARESENKLKSVLWKIKWRIKNYKNVVIFRELRQRRKAFETFNQGKIRHSNVYSNATLHYANSVYDVFITGSDQVWHPSAVCSAYLLDFAHSDKIKLSYAASLAVNSIPQSIADRYRKSLADFSGISVRENNAIDILQGLVNKRVECVLDPTLLLSKEDWDKVCEDYTIPEQYILCYFLGDNVEQRKIADLYARKRNLKIVTFPHMLGAYRECDANFGDYRLYDVSPAQFLTLIKCAEGIFTDSFHASVFSIIYQKDFVVFERSKYKSMGSRIYTLTEMFNVTERFCDTDERQCIEYVESLGSIDYSQENEKFKQNLELSGLFLRRSLGMIKDES